MKIILTIVTSLISGLVLASTSYSPLGQIQHLIENKRRFLYSIAFALSGFVFVMAGIITAIIEAGLQYEVQGFVFWSALFTVSSVFVVGGFLCWAAAKLSLPELLPQPSPFAALEKQFNISKILETLLATLGEHEARQAASSHNAPPAKPESKTQFREQAPIRDDFPASPSPDVPSQFAQGSRTELSH